MITCSYIGRNYKDLLNITVPTWKGEVIIYSDSDDFGVKLFEPCEDMKESWHRKILIIQKTLKEHQGENVLYLDGDVLMNGDVENMFDKDLTVTRMVVRPERPQYQEINAGVSFWKANERTLKLCDEWLRLEKEFTHPDIPYAEQRALNMLAYKGYDGISDWTVGNVSENVYNFERDDTKQFMEGVKKYNPKLIHLKGGRWKQEFSLNFLKEQGILN